MFSVWPVGMPSMRSVSIAEMALRSFTSLAVVYQDGQVHWNSKYFLSFPNCLCSPLIVDFGMQVYSGGLFQTYEVDGPTSAKFSQQTSWSYVLFHVADLALSVRYIVQPGFIVVLLEYL